VARSEGSNFDASRLGASCAYCGRRVRQRHLPRSDQPVSLCPECSRNTGAGVVSLGEFLDRFDLPCILVDGNGLILAANRFAAELFGRELTELVGLPGGDAIQCIHTRAPVGCGRTIHCLACGMRNAVVRSRQSGGCCFQLPARVVRRDGGTVQLLVTTTPDGDLTRVFLEPSQLDRIVGPFDEAVPD
jgi:PAS domain-containing protein